jgi:starch synthase
VERLRVLSVASEIFPIVKTGGLADVVGALPHALAREGVDVSTLIPGYPAVLNALADGEPVLEIADLFGGPARVIAATVAGLKLYVVEAPHLYDRVGGPYVDHDGNDWPDNAFRFAALAQIGARIGQGAIADVRPDIIHAHDWQTGLVPAYIHYSGRPGPATVVTIHNLAFAGRFAADVLAPLGLPPAAFAIDGVEYFGDVSFLKAGLQFADRITTVSPTYAIEIATPESGMGFDGLLRARGDRFSGILNGIDADVWDPAHDPLITAPYDAERPAPRARNTAALRRRFALDDEPAALLVGIVSRLSWQKGLDLLLDALPRLISRGIQFAVLGAGDAPLESGFTDAVAAYPGRIGVYVGYDEAVAHLVQAGANAILVPSRFEPCGLTQLCALRYGAIPIVSRVGGLADTVIDANEMGRAAGVATGIVFAPPASQALESALVRATDLFAHPADWQRMQRNAMRADVSWDRSGRQYAQLYRDMIGSSRRPAASLP